MKTRIARLNEQGAIFSIGQYGGRWVRWIFSELKVVHEKMLLNSMVKHTIQIILTCHAGVKVQSFHNDQKA